MDSIFKHISLLGTSDEPGKLLFDRGEGVLDARRSQHPAGSKIPLPRTGIRPTVTAMCKDRFELLVMAARPMNLVKQAVAFARLSQQGALSTPALNLQGCFDGVVSDRQGYLP